jgi:hypothetical protein
MDVELVVTDKDGRRLAAFVRGRAPEYAAPDAAERLRQALGRRRLPRGGLPAVPARRRLLEGGFWLTTRSAPPATEGDPPCPRAVRPHERWGPPAAHSPRSGPVRMRLPPSSPKPPRGARPGHRSRGRGAAPRAARRGDQVDWG